MYKFLNIDTARMTSGTIFSFFAVIVEWLNQRFGGFFSVGNFFIYLFLFIAVDFITGVIASKKRAKESKQKFVFSSEKCYDTIYKLFFCCLTIFLTWLLDEKMIPDVDLNLEAYVCAFFCGVEFWSFLENASEISNHKIFRLVRKYTKEKIKEAIHDDTNVIDEIK